MTRHMAYGLAISLMLSPIVAAHAEGMSKYECEINQKAASAAADSAIMSQHEVSKAVVGVAAGGSCLALFYIMGWFDGGATAAICGLATAGAVVATPAPASAETAQEAYKSVRNPSCVGQ